MRLTILYGTQTGNAERLAFRVARLALKRGVTSVRCLPADDIPIEQWSTHQRHSDATPEGGNKKEEEEECVLLVCSNANQGDAPTTIRATWSRLLQPSAPRLEGLRFAVFGLGDSLYIKYNYMAKMLHNRMRQLGAEPVVLRGLGDESDAKGIDETLLPWLMGLWVALGLIPEDAVGQGQQEDPLGGPLFPLYTVKHITCSQKDVDYSPGVPYYREDAFVCRVTRNVRLTAADHFQAVHHIEVEREPDALSTGDNRATAHALPTIQYEVGDALGVFCRNRPKQVEELLARLGLNGDDVVVVVRADDAHGIVAQPQRAFMNRPMTIHHLLSCYVDLDAVVSQEFFWMLARLLQGQQRQQNAGSDAQGEGDDEEEERREVVERLLEFASPLNVDEFLRYSHREKRNVCEVLHDFHTVHVPLAYLLSFATVMQPRYFSFSSAPAMDPANTAHLTVAQLTWQTPMKRDRAGLCSSFLVSAAVGTQLVCHVWQGNLMLPGEPAPLLCIATGTGLAPVRSILRQCVGVAAAAAASSLVTSPSWSSTPIYFFFGCRSKEKDFLYAEEWEHMRSSGALSKLTIVPAFSRDTAKKVYVQHQLGQHARLVGSLLGTDACREGSGMTSVYVCGNAKQMPKDVQGALLQIMEAVCCGGNEEEAAAMMKQLTREGRYQVDTWSA